ncbi:MAG: SulP family inorganic anion transporter [Deltaproteobacteria bacterium]|nr:MAG: SulP family inorganic anion transporter [Deltaproteobacteria bacterium]
MRGGRVVSAPSSSSPSGSEPFLEARGHLYSSPLLTRAFRTVRHLPSIAFLSSLHHLLDPGRFRQEWFSNIRLDLLAGFAVALALIPEAIAFSLIAGVDPKVGLYASFTIAVVTSLFGGRPGMISGATGAMALLMIPLVAQHGIEYLFAATVLTGIIQVVFRILRLSRYMKFVPRSVMTGFVNALAILIFMAQVPYLLDGGMLMLAIVFAGILIIYGLPRITTAIPSPVVAIVVLTAIVLMGGMATHTVGDMGALPSTLPFFHIPMVPLSMETLSIIAPYAFAMAMVGLIESLLTAAVVDEMTDTPSCKHSEAYGQGVANIVTGFFGGMAGCAMIGQSVINVKSGGRGRLSTLCAGVFLLFLVVVLGEWVARIPTGALVAVMITVAIGTFDWKALRRVRRMPLTETIVTVATVGTVVATHDLFLGVLVGVLLSAIFFARSVGKLIDVKQDVTLDGTRVYLIHGQLFFVAVEEFCASFDFDTDPGPVILDFRHAHVWDASAVAAIDRIVLKLRAVGCEVRLRGLNPPSAALLDRIAVHDSPGAGALASGH